MDSANTPSSPSPDELLQAVLTGDLEPDDPRLLERARADSEFQAELEGLIDLRLRLDRAGTTERATLRRVRQELRGERIALQSDFRERAESWILDQMADPGGPVAAPQVEPPRSAPAPVEAQPARPAAPLLRFGALLAAAAALVVWFRSGDNTPSQTPDDFRGIWLGEGDLQPELVLDPSGLSGTLTWAPPVGIGTAEVEILEQAPGSEPRMLLRTRPLDPNELRLDPLPWPAEHPPVRIEVRWFTPGLEIPESEGVLELPSS